MTLTPSGLVEEHQREAFSARLRVLIAEHVLAAREHGADFVALWEAVGALADGGKLFRPALVTSVVAALTDDPAARADATEVGIAFELLHLAFLVHDDVIDRDDRRRGIPTVSARFRDRAAASGRAAAEAERIGQTAGILAGDLLLHAAQRRIALLDAPGGTRTALLDLLDRTVFRTAAGEFADVLGGHDAEPDLESSLRVCRDKTAVYSFEAPLQAAGLLAGAPPRLVELLGEIGCEIGVAFQIGDDLLGLFGDEERIGKSTLSDLRAGTFTPVIACAALTPSWPRIRRGLGDPELGPGAAGEIRDEIERSGARARAEDLLREHLGRAGAAASADIVPARVRFVLEQLVDLVRERSA